MKDYYCPCCGFKTLESEHEYDICPICFWEDDPYQFEDYNSLGANKVSLRQARVNYAKFGACEEESARHVRKPTDVELKDRSWTVEITYLVPEVVPPNLAEQAISLSQHGVNSVAWKADEAIRVIEILTSEGYIILGGDVYSLKNGYTSITGDSWYMNEDEYWSDCFSRSKQRAVSYINNYRNRNGENYCYDMVFKLDESGVKR